MDNVGELRLQIEELEEERRELLSRNQALKEDAKAAALYGQNLLERCVQLEEENKQVEEAFENYRHEHPEDNRSDSSPAESPRPDELPRRSDASQDSRTSGTSLEEVSHLRQQNYIQRQHTQQLERDLRKKEKLVCALEEEKRGLIFQLAEQRREDSTLLQKLEHEKGGLAEQLEELNVQVRAQEKLIANLGQQLGTAQEELETQGGKSSFFSIASNIRPRGRTPPLPHARRQSDGIGGFGRPLPSSIQVDDDSFGDGNRELLETFAEEFRNISGSQRTLVSNMDAKIRDVQDQLESLSMTLNRPSMHTQATMNCLQMEDTGDILDTLQDLQEQLVSVHASVGSLEAQPDTRATLGEVEGMITRNLQSFQDQLRAKLEALQEQQESSSRQLRDKFDAFHEQQESLGGLLTQKALDGLSTEMRDSGRDEAERLRQEVVRLCEQLTAKLEGTRAGYEKELARAVEGFQLEKESLGDIVAQKALDRLSAERLNSNGGEAERLQQEVTHLHEQLAAKQQELARTAEGFQLEKAGLLQLLGSALDGLSVERREAGRGEAERVQQEVARVCDQLAAKLEVAKAGCQQNLALAVQGFELEKGLAIEAPRGAAEPPRASEDLEREAQRLRTELASAEQRVEDGLQDRQRLSRAMEGARRDMAGLQAELERLRAAPEVSASELREEVARLRRQLTAEREAQKRIQRQADTDVVRSLVALRDLDANFFSPTR